MILIPLKKLLKEKKNNKIENGRKRGMGGHIGTYRKQFFPTFFKIELGKGFKSYRTLCTYMEKAHVAADAPAAVVHFVACVAAPHFWAFLHS